MTKVTMEQWRMFHAVVKYGGFAQAAEKIFKSVSSVHYSVCKLENLLNVSLLKVEGRRTTLTAHGEQVFSSVEKLLTDAISLEEYVTGLNKKPSNNLKIAIDETFPMSVLRKVLQTTCNDSLLKNLEINQVSSHHCNTDVNSEYALAVMKTPLSGYSVESRFKVSYIAVTQRKNPAFANSVVVSSQDLYPHREIRVEKTQCPLMSGNENVWVVDKLSSAIELVCEGVGYAWLPELDVRQYLQDGRLKQLILIDRPNTNESDFYLNVRHDVALNPDVAALAKNFSAFEHQSPSILTIPPVQLAS